MPGMSLAGDVRSPYALLLPAGLALAWGLEGRAAAPFFAALSVLAAEALVLLGTVSVEDPASRLPLLAIALTCPALLAALESAGIGRPAEAAENPLVVSSSASASDAVASGSRHTDGEILHDLRSPLSVIRVYTDLIAEGARRGELPTRSTWAT